MVRLAAFAGASAAVLASSNAFTVTITNGCSSDIDLYTRLASVYTDESETIAPGASIEKTIEKGYEGHFRNGTSDAATLIEFATKGDLDLAWYDIGIIPPRLKPGFEYCTSLQECKDNSESGIGYNTPVQVTPTSNTGIDTCREITCLADGCEDAYNYPQDDTKTHSCAFGTDFVVTFCPSGDSTTQDATQQQEQTSSGSTTQEETPAPETTAPVVTEAPTTEAPATGAPATDAPVQQASAASDNGAGKVHTQDEDVNGESETTSPDVTQTETTAPEVTPTSTPKSKYCV
ncbi:Thaumatin-like protein [Phytophthora palmivora]|uniref:Thaumatin-like protein n=1 Tax=Phytophthora palmivora TaxID=4796 RepID=A0A2P4Y015_9STRA|nr:Thaumatin-like protein [Phytophthora palmivora]